MGHRGRGEVEVQEKMLGCLGKRLWDQILFHRGETGVLHKACPSFQVFREHGDSRKMVKYLPQERLERYKLGGGGLT